MGPEPTQPPQTPVQGCEEEEVVVRTLGMLGGFAPGRHRPPQGRSSPKRRPLPCGPSGRVVLGVGGAASPEGTGRRDRNESWGVPVPEAGRALRELSEALAAQGPRAPYLSEHQRGSSPAGPCSFQTRANGTSSSQRPNGMRRGVRLNSPLRPYLLCPLRQGTQHPRVQLQPGPTEFGLGASSPPALFMVVALLVSAPWGWLPRTTPYSAFSQPCPRGQE